jgi:hypothetical protein
MIFFPWFFLGLLLDNQLVGLRVCSFFSRHKWKENDDERKSIAEKKRNTG